jgi:hypothetical protein
VVARWDADEYEVMEHNLEGLMAGILNMSIEEVPRHYQCHTIGMSNSLSRFLSKVAREIVCYREWYP